MAIFDGSNDEVARHKAFGDMFKRFFEQFPDEVSEQSSQQSSEQSSEQRSKQPPNQRPELRLSLSDTVQVCDGSGTEYSVAVGRIAYCTSSGKNLVLYAATKMSGGEELRPFRIKKTTLKALLARLPEGEFVAVRRDCAVRLAKVARFSGPERMVVLRLPQESHEHYKHYEGSDANRNTSRSAGTRSRGTVLKSFTVSARELPRVRAAIRAYRSRAFFDGDFSEDVLNSSVGEES